MGGDGGGSNVHFPDRGLEVVKWKAGEMMEGTKSYRCQVLLKFLEIKCCVRFITY